jgi:hypothetical protein
VRFHVGGDFIRIGPNLQYVGGDEEMSYIERDKLSLHELIGFVKDHVQFKESMKFYFLMPVKDLASGLVFLHDDSGVLNIAEYIPPGDVADVFVEYHGEEDSQYNSSGSDFEDELVQISDGEKPDMIIMADLAESSYDEVIVLEDVLIDNDNGVITEVIRSPIK